jgi:hypothetical protein
VRRALLAAAVGAAVALPLTACAVPVHGRAAPAAALSSSSTSAAAPSSRPTTDIPGGAVSPCLVADTCGNGTGAGTSGGSGGPRAGLVCAPLSAAVAAFDAAASPAFPGGEVSTSGSAAAMQALSSLAGQVVDGCGFEVMAVVAAHYPDPLAAWLTAAAVSSLGSLAGLPAGLRCADLAAQGYTAKNAVDYWFLWGAPALMDADSNGIPCETVFPDVARYMPAL